MKNRYTLLLATLASLSLAAGGLAQDKKSEDAPRKPDQKKAEPEKPEPKKPELKKPEAPKGPEKSEGRPDFGKMRDAMHGRMEEVRKLHAAGKHDEAEEKMAEIKKHMSGLREKFGHRFGHGERPPFAGGPDSKKPEPPKPADKPEVRKGPDKPKPRHPAPGMARGHGHLPPQMDEIRKLREAGKYEEAWKKFDEMRAQFRSFGPGHGPMASRPGEHRPGSGIHRRPDGKGPRAHRHHDRPGSHHRHHGKADRGGKGKHAKGHHGKEKRRKQPDRGHRPHGGPDHGERGGHHQPPYDRKGPPPPPTN